MADESLNVAPLVARLLGVAVVVLDDTERVLDADASACRLLGAANVDALRGKWDALRQRRPFAEVRRATTDERAEPTLDGSMSPDESALRLEVHRLAPDRKLVLLRGKRCVDERDKVGLLASEALANRYVLSGLVHNAKGPLNNFYLRLALLESMLARQTPGETSAAPWSRHLETLQQEAQELLKCVEEIRKLAHPEEGLRDDIDLNVVLADLARLLRHAATIREAGFDVSLPATSSIVRGNAHDFSLALVSLATCMLDSTRPKARLTITLARDDLAARITLNATPATLPAGMSDAMFNLHARNAGFVAQTTARIVIERHGGDLRIITNRDDDWGFALTIPIAHGND